jgi:hypothetical protein
MFAAFAFAWIASFTALPQSGMQAAVDAVHRGDFAAAERAADAEPQSLPRHQARVYVRHQAGDLDGALEEVESGARAFPTDAWLQDRRAYIALTMRRARIAEDAVNALERTLSSASTAEAQRWSSAAAGYRTELTDLRRMLSARDRCETRAIWVAVVGVLASGIAVLWLARDDSARGGH